MQWNGVLVLLNGASRPPTIVWEEGTPDGLTRKDRARFEFDPYRLRVQQDESLAIFGSTNEVDCKEFWNSDSGARPD
jgi:hypothetical protein